MLINILSFFIVFFASAVGCLLYKKLALRIKIISKPNFRTLHQSPTPSGGGIIFSLIFVIIVFYLWWINQLANEIFFVLGIGGFFAAFFGFFDDLNNIGAIRKLIVQFFLSVWAIYWLDVGIFSNIDWVPYSISIALSVLFLVWVINAYNFIDGIDGLAISGAILVTGGLILIMLLTNSSSELTILYFLLMASAGAFILFNWTPASIFMGDAGSIFLGYIFGSLILLTIERGEVSVWTWLVIFGYFFADTTITQIMRLILVKKWYVAHRSHAYQNLARITGSHLKITGGIVIYHFVWLLPLTLWTIKQPESGVFAAILAVVPAALIAVKFGPLSSSS